MSLDNGKNKIPITKFLGLGNYENLLDSKKKIYVEP